MPFRILFLLLAFHPLVTHAGNLISVEHGGSTIYFAQDSLQQAIDFAQDGDVIYLPGGDFTSTSLLIDKSISLIGVGYFPDSTLATGASIGPDVSLTSNASGSYFSGLRLGEVMGASGQDPVIHDVMFHRCQINGFATGSSSGSINLGSSNISFVECYLTRVINLWGANNCHVSNCILYPLTSSHVANAQNAIIQNCIFMPGGSSTTISSCSNCIVINNVFVHTNSSINGGSIGAPVFVRNNCFVAASLSGGFQVQVSNTFGVSFTSLFQGYSSPYDYSDDLHLAPGSPALGAGIEGIDCGIYDGPSPWKAGSVPFNPHISTQNVAPTTNPQGELPVTIRVNAQDH